MLELNLRFLPANEMKLRNCSAFANFEAGSIIVFYTPKPFLLQE